MFARHAGSQRTAFRTRNRLLHGTERQPTHELALRQPADQGNGTLPVCGRRSKGRPISTTPLSVVTICLGYPLGSDRRTKESRMRSPWRSMHAYLRGYAEAVCRAVSMGNTLDHPRSPTNRDTDRKTGAADGLYAIPARPKGRAGRRHLEALLRALGFDDDGDDRSRNDGTVAVLGRLLPASGNHRQTHLLALVRRAP